MVDFWGLGFAPLYFFEPRNMDYVPGLSERERSSFCALPENGSSVQIFCSAVMWFLNSGSIPELEYLPLTSSLSSSKQCTTKQH